MVASASTFFPERWSGSILGRRDDEICYLIVIINDFPFGRSG
jgi:hypothetical protein